MKEKSDSQNTLVVKEHFRKFYICDACTTNCYFCVTNTHGSLPLPKLCPYEVDPAVKPNWRPLFE